MPSSLYVPALLAGMILTGSCNSLWTKWQDMQCVEACADPDPALHVLYEQPVWQTLQMFLGEMLCFLPVLFAALSARPKAPIQLPDDDDALPPALTGYKVLVFWIPAICDLTGTTLMNIGLFYTPVSIYQMTRGALVLFVGTFSVIFLRRRLHLYQWVSLIIVMSGVALVGYSGSLIRDALTRLPPIRDLLAEDPQLANVVIGVFFVLFAQIFTATQFVVEEKIMEKYSVPPLVAVGYEGLFGTVSVLLAFPILSLPAISKLSPFFDIPRGWHQMVDNPPVLYSGVAIAFSIAFFNFFGLSVTRHVSATARSLTDTCRTLSIWLISLGLGWETFLFPISLLQVAGFSLLVYGTFLFNDLISIPPCLPKPILPAVDSEGAQPDSLLSPSAALDQTATLPADLGQAGFDVIPQDQPTRR